MTSRSYGGWVCVLVLALVIGGSSARAEDPQRAKALFQEGTVLFDIGQYDRAIEVWQRGYQEKQDPGFLYNIAQAYRLAGDPRRAIQFYKSFLRNSPKAANRQEIEQKIAALQKQISESDPAGQSPSTAPRVVPPAATPVRAAPSVPAAQAIPSTPPGSPPPQVAQVPDFAGRSSGYSDGIPPTPTVAVAPMARGRAFDVGARLGSTFWLSGLDGAADPSLGVAASFGYTFGSETAARARFRLGGLIGYTFLDDVDSKVNFVSVLVDPTVRLRIAGERLFFSADVGFGLLAIGGLESTSALLDSDTGLSVSGTQPLLEVRPGVGMEYRFLEAWSLLAGSGLAYSPKRANFHASLVRLDLHLGLAFRM